MENRVNGRKRPKARGRASLQDVLGGALGSGKPRRRRLLHRKWTEHHQSLTRLRERFAGDVRNRSENARIPLSISDEHMADGATDSYERDWALAMASSDQDALYEIDEALNRIANGTYGICELTGRPIEAARLRSIPWTRFCARAQADLEARGLGGRTQLGELGTYSRAGESDKADEDEREEEAPAERQAA
jgi:DnaK suppressor protein